MTSIDPADVPHRVYRRIDDRLPIIYDWRSGLTVVAMFASFIVTIAVACYCLGAIYTVRLPPVEHSTWTIDALFLGVVEPLVLAVLGTTTALTTYLSFRLANHLRHRRIQEIHRAQGPGSTT